MRCSLSCHARSPDCRACHRPPDGGRFWAGLGPATHEAPRERRAASCAAAARGRVRIPGGTFVMGVDRRRRWPTPRPLRARGARHGMPSRRGSSRSCARRGIAHPVTLSTLRAGPHRGDRRRLRRMRRRPGRAQPAELGRRPAVHAARLPGHARALGRRGRLLPLGRRTAADRGGVGVRRARNRRPRVPLGRRLQPAPGQPRRRGPTTAPTRPTASSGLAPVGSFPDGATPLGLLDMAGNVAEWVADLLEIDKTGDPVGYGDEPEVDPLPHTTGGGSHVVRGGSFAGRRHVAEDDRAGLRSGAPAGRRGSASAARPPPR